MVNAHHEDIDFTLPPVEYGSHWAVVLDTGDDTGAADSGDTFAPSGVLPVTARSLVVLCCPRDVAPAPGATVGMAEPVPDWSRPTPVLASTLSAGIPPPRPVRRLSGATPP
jgi:hypothetical protein